MWLRTDRYSSGNESFNEKKKKTQFPDRHGHSPHPVLLGLHAHASCWPETNTQEKVTLRPQWNTMFQRFTTSKKAATEQDKTFKCKSQDSLLLGLVKHPNPKRRINQKPSRTKPSPCRVSGSDLGSLGTLLLTLISSSCSLRATSMSFSSCSRRSSFFKPLVASLTPYSVSATTAPLPRCTIRPADVGT